MDDNGDEITYEQALEWEAQYGVGYAFNRVLDALPRREREKPMTDRQTCPATDHGDHMWRPYQSHFGRTAGLAVCDACGLLDRMAEASPDKEATDVD